MSDHSITVLGDVCTVIDCEHKTAPSSDFGFPLIRTPNIGNGRLMLDNVFRVSEKTYAAWTRRARPEPGDLIMAREAPVGNVGLIQTGQKVCLGQRTVLLRLKDRSRTNPAFISYLMNSPAVNSYVNLLSNGATVGHLNVGDIRRLKLPRFPTFDVQKRIAGVLAAYDDLIENNRRRIALLERMAEQLYREWFVRFRFPGYQQAKFSKGLPAEWGVGKLSEIIELGYGKALKEQDRVPGPFPVYGSSGQIGTHKNLLVDGPGIVVGRKGNVGSVHWCDSGFFPIDTAYYVKSNVSKFYLFFLLQTMNFLNNDAAVPGLSRQQAYANDVLRPPSALIKQFEQVVKPMFVLRSMLSRGNDKLVKTRDLLLPRLISGKLRVDDLDIRFPSSMQAEGA